MPSNKEKIFEDHIVSYLTDPKKHNFRLLFASDLPDKEFHLCLAQLIEFIIVTQKAKYDKLVENYGIDAVDEISKALRSELDKRPLWVIIRNGLPVRSINFDLYYPKPRSNFGQTALFNYEHNIFAVKPQYHFCSDDTKSIDIVIYLNGLPLVTLEVKHEDEGQNVYDAVEQYNIRPQDNRIFSLPFLHIAADTSEVQVATNPFAEINFQWFNQNLVNVADDKEHEYPIEYLYKKALSKDQLLEYLSFYLIFLPPDHKVTPDGITLIEPAKTIFPRYHQFRCNQKLADDLLDHFNSVQSLGKKYLINHSAGSGKTLTISWLADRLDSLYSDNNTKLFDIVFILTDRRSLDKNIKDELINFAHLQKKIGYTKNSDQLRKFILERKSIVATTIQKFAYVQEVINEDPLLKTLRIAFIIDEAHRGQDGKMASHPKAIFSKPDEPDDENLPTEEEEIVEAAKKVNISNQVLIAFTATPIQSTVTFFGAPIDEYSEDEAIKEKYILDVANNIISYSTLYHLKSKNIIPADEQYPAGIISKALRDVAYRDPELIQYKSEVILKYFEDKVKDTLGGRSKAMLVASSRPAGLLYYKTLKEKIASKGLPYKVLFAFSDFRDEKGIMLREEELNELVTKHGGQKIEDVFDENDDYRIMVVAHKFQTGFNQPRLVAMFLDKVVRGVNAVQTLSRLNRNYFEKDMTMVIDFTNSVAEIYEAFAKYRKGNRFEPHEPNPDILEARYKQFLSWNIFSEAQIIAYTLLVQQATTDAAKDAELMSLSSEYRVLFKKKRPKKEDQKEIVQFLSRFVSDFYFITMFFQLQIPIVRFALFAEMIGDKLVKKGSVASLKDHLKGLLVEKSAVRYSGVITNISEIKEPHPPSGPKSGGNVPPRKSIPEVMQDLKTSFQISDEEAILINQVVEELMKDQLMVKIIRDNSNNKLFLEYYHNTLKQRIINYYLDNNWDDRLMQGPYISPGGIIEYITNAVIRLCLSSAA